MADDTAAAVEATRESPDDAKNKAELVTQWLDALALASTDEEPWRKDADRCVKIYRQGDENRKADGTGIGSNERRFNILHANVETIVPSIYNSTPSPDVRRRFNDADPVGKQVADILERCLAHSVDAYDFDAAIRATVYDMELAGRGIDRVRYVPYLNADESSVDYEEVQCEHVAWKHFRRGPARMWGDVPWIAFELFLTRDELEKLSPSLGSKVQLDCEIERAEKRDGQNIPEIWKRARVWEIWDKDAKKVIFIATGYKEKPIREENDPLELMGFFPIPRPLYAIETSDTLVPVTPYSIYEDQAEELERITRRIMVLTEMVKVRGAYDGAMDEIGQLADKDDGEMVAIKNVANFATTGSKGIENGIAWWPIEPAIIALKQLYEQREQIKQTIYEITGIADIMRGQTEPSETLGAQQLKTQWGSLRVQRKQAEVQRYVRDLFRIKAEIIATKFKPETIQIISGVILPPAQVKQQAQMAAQQLQQAGQPVPPKVKEILDKPSWDEVEPVLRNDAMRGFRVDVESDSTIRADLTRNQQNMNMFLQGTAQYGAAMGPIVQEMPGAMSVVVKIYEAFARNYKLGKQAEDDIEKLGEIATQAAAQPKPNPEMEKMKMEAQSAQQKMQLDASNAQQKLQLQAQADQATAQREQAKLQADIQMQREKLAAEMELKRYEMEATIKLERELANTKLQSEIMIAHARANSELEISRQQHETSQAQSAEAHQAEMKQRRQANGARAQ